MSPILLAALLTPDAQAFCGTYMGSAGADLFNSASQVVAVRQDGRTTLTLANDYQGDLTQFALVVPVPEVLSEDDVRTVDATLFERVDLYSSPRRVSYECSDFYADTGDAALDADSGGSGGGGGGVGGVEVEAEFAVGEYSIVILSATESEGLVDWLQSNGYAIPDGADELLGEYIAGGSYFFAAQVDLDELPEGSSWLSPLQFGYDSEVFSLPIRLGTINADGDQDLILYTITDESDGQVHISNYPQIEVEDECMWPVGEQEFGEFYGSTFQDAVRDSERPGWVLEYSWSPGWCDPCTTDPPTEEEVGSLGYDGDLYSAWFTRLHMRYGADDVDQDLVLYESGLTGTEQIRYIDYDVQLEDRFPVCGVGMVEDPGSCGDSGGGGVDGSGEDDDDDDDDKGCTTAAASTSLLSLLPGLAVLVGTRRRR